jgi:hypothetical protein
MYRISHVAFDKLRQLILQVIFEGKSVLNLCLFLSSSQLKPMEEK